MVFEDGLPRKSEYRRFAVRGVDGQDDVASMREVVGRRFRRYLDERETATDLEIAPLGDAADGVDRRRTPRHRPGHRAAHEVRLPARTCSWSTAGPRRSRRRSEALDELGIDDVAVVRAGQAARGGLAARRRRPGDPAAHQRGALPAAAGARRGAPVRHHLPPAAAVQVA